ncbi:DMT family transporter [Tellurirhabdus bombi]|uniref:DMT family transporter n=1 Tax=Tellurirhabdus bombi TaxID=2907205 RepID=UPI001F180E61|nr:DMT family transporter [Tellurirhabdus bombi]
MIVTDSTKQTQVRYWTGALLVFLAAFCFALKGVLIKIAYQYHIDSISLLTLRMLFALPFYIGIVFRLSTKLPPVQLSMRSWIWIALLGVAGYYIASFLNFWGLEYITASLERILLFVYPTFVLLLGVIFFRRRVSWLQAIAVFLTYSGIFQAFVPYLDATEQRGVFLGAGLIILSGLAYAIYLVGSDTMIAKVGTQRYTCYAMIAATFFVLLHCALANGLSLFRYPAPVYWLSFLMAIVVTVIPTFMMTEGIKRVGSGNASIIASIGPIFTIVLATSLLNESISMHQLVGTLLVLVGVFLIGWKGKK